MKISIEQVEEFFSNRAMDVAEGVADPMDVYAELSRTEKLTNALKDAVKAEAIERAKEHGADKEKVSYHGHTFQFRQGRSIYNYKHIAPWKAAEAEKKRIEELAKAAAKAQQEIADPETGEAIAPVIVTYASDSLIVSKD
jgi:predicted transcriptional regulator